MSEHKQREQMVRDQIKGRDVSDARVLEAMLRVPRHRFVPESLRDRAYEDRPQPIGAEQTISQPLMVGIMTELLQLTGNEKVLEVGTGSGYQAAILAELAAEVITVERHEPLAERTRGLLEHLGYQNVEIHVGDGTEGYPRDAPYDRILVTAASPSIPQPLLDQLAHGGRMVIPVGQSDMQALKVVYKDLEGNVTVDDCGHCLFVPLVGKYGWGE